MDFEVEVNKILKAIPRERRTYLFSATMTQKVLETFRVLDKQRLCVSLKVFVRFISFREHH